MTIVTMTIAYRYTHRAYGKIYGVSVSGDQAPIGMPTGHATYAEAMQKVEDFKKWRPCWVRLNSKTGENERLFDFRYLVNWDFASFDRIQEAT